MCWSDRDDTAVLWIQQKQIEAKIYYIGNGISNNKLKNHTIFENQRDVAESITGLLNATTCKSTTLNKDKSTINNIIKSSDLNAQVFVLVAF